MPTKVPFMNWQGLPLGIWQPGNFGENKAIGIVAFDVQAGLLSIGRDTKEQRDDWRDLCLTAGVTVVEPVGW